MSPLSARLDAFVSEDSLSEALAPLSQQLHIMSVAAITPAQLEDALTGG